MLAPYKVQVKLWISREGKHFAMRLFSTGGEMRFSSFASCGLAAAVSLFIVGSAQAQIGQQQPQQYGQQPWQQQLQQRLGQIQQQYPQQFGQMQERFQSVQERLQAANRFRQALQGAGLQNIQVVESAYLITAQTPSGETVAMLVSPPGGPLGAFGVMRPASELQQFGQLGSQQN
jgi:TolA-binding protein